jgi:hypothetical protein
MKYTNIQDLIAFLKEHPNKRILAVAQDPDVPLWALYRAYRSAHALESVDASTFAHISQSILENPALSLLAIEDPSSLQRLLQEISSYQEPERISSGDILPEPLETKACPHCGDTVVSCPWPCLTWDCAFHNHLPDCPSVEGLVYREMIAKKKERRGLTQ